MPDETALTATTPDSGAVPDATAQPVDSTAPAPAAETNAEGTTQEQAAKPDGEAPKGDTASKEDAKPSVPDHYDFKLPDGVTLDDSAVETVTPVLKELGVSQEGAQKLADAFMSIQANQTARQSEAWLSEAKNDKEIGGAKWDESTKLAQRAFAEFATPDLKALMESTGLGNHPAILKTFVSLARRSAQDTHVVANAIGIETDRAQRLFPLTK